MNQVRLKLYLTYTLCYGSKLFVRTGVFCVSQNQQVVYSRYVLEHT